MELKKLDEFIDLIPKRGFPACELAVTLDGKEIYHRCAGYSDSARTKPATENDLYWIYSTTKVITCIAAMRLVEEGRIGLDDPVSKYIPEYANVKIQNSDGTLSSPKGEMKIVHLFTMTAGLTYNEDTLAIRKALSENCDTVEFARAVAEDPLIFEPGTRYKYSLCHDILGAVIEVVTGMRLSQYFDELLFEPLGLKNIGFYPTEEQKTRFSAMYRYNKGPSTAYEIPCVNEYNPMGGAESGGAGLFCTARDYLSVITAIACGGTAPNGHRILKPETVAMMQKNHLNDICRSDLVGSHNFGYGWGLCGRVHVDPTVSLSPTPIGEFGWDGALNSWAMIDPKNKLALFYASHVRSATYGYVMIHPEIKRLLYEGLGI